ncbi:uncharacterized protein LOC125236278 isoform X2 [Leguminivora glycinivorella]|nr:uncharacterized protein LOC125236278 isoform X2 [Leguminivora glycinivorella]
MPPAAVSSQSRASLNSVGVPRSRRPRFAAPAPRPRRAALCKVQSGAASVATACAPRASRFCLAFSLATARSAGPGGRPPSLRDGDGRRNAASDQSSTESRRRRSASTRRSPHPARRGVRTPRVSRRVYL